MKIIKVKFLSYTLIIVVLMMFFQNCGSYFTLQQYSSSSNSLAMKTTFTPTGLSRFTPDQYKNTVVDFTGETVDLKGFPVDSKVEHLSNNSTQLFMSSLALEYFMDNAIQIAANTNINIADFFQCTNKGNYSENKNCLSESLSAILLKAFRRPVTESEKQAYLDLYKESYSLKGEADHSFGLRNVLMAILVSPNFLYQTKGQVGSALNSYQQITKLSYFLTSGPPDAELYSLASENTVITEEQLSAQARRLLKTTRAKKQMKKFVFQWLGIDEFSISSKENKALDGVNKENLEIEMIKQAEDLVEQALLNGGSLASLFKNKSTFNSSLLANTFGDDYSERVGIVGLPIVLAHHSKVSAEPSPMQRGSMIRDHLFCQVFPETAGSAAMTLPNDSTGRLAFQERFGLLENVQSCSKCHQYLNSAFSMEKYDNIGRSVFGNPNNFEFGGVLNNVDSLGFLPDEAGNGVAYSNTAEFLNGITESPAIYQCFAKQLFRFAQQNTESNDHLNERISIINKYNQDNSDFEQLIVNIVSSKAFSTGN